MPIALNSWDQIRLLASGELGKVNFKEFWLERPVPKLDGSEFFGFIAAVVPGIERRDL